MKVRKNSISWIEPGRLIRARRKPGAPTFAQSALLAAAIGALVALVLVKLKPGVPFGQPDAWIFVGAGAAGGVVIAVWLHFGRIIAFSEQSVARVLLGSRFPRTIKYETVRQCLIDSYHSDGEDIPVLRMLLVSGREEEIELVRQEDSAVVAKFLADNGVSVEFVERDSGENRNDSG